MISNTDISKPFVNDPALLRATKVRALRPFCIEGKPAIIGEIITIPWHVGRDLVALKRAEWIKT